MDAGKQDAMESQITLILQRNSPTFAKRVKNGKAADVLFCLTHYLTS